MESPLTTTTRTQVYLRDGRLFPVTSARPTGRGPWPRVLGYRFDELVAIVEGGAGGIEIKEGPADVLKKSLDRKRLEILVTQLAPPAPRRPGERRMNLRRGQQG